MTLNDMDYMVFMWTQAIEMKIHHTKCVFSISASLHPKTDELQLLYNPDHDFFEKSKILRNDLLFSALHC